jgi:hypothetical protein
MLQMENDFQMGPKSYRRWNGLNPMYKGVLSWQGSRLLKGDRPPVHEPKMLLLRLTCILLNKFVCSSLAWLRFKQA